MFFSRHKLRRLGAGTGRAYMKCPVVRQLAERGQTVRRHEPGRAYRKCPVAQFSVRGQAVCWLEPIYMKKQPFIVAFCGPSWARTSDPLIMSQVLLTS